VIADPSDKELFPEIKVFPSIAVNSNVVFLTTRRQGAATWRVKSRAISHQLTSTTEQQQDYAMVLNTKQ
jgi:hypothetical protein